MQLFLFFIKFIANFKSTKELRELNFSSQLLLVY
jgi:hypothetical protein